MSRQTVARLISSFGIPFFCSGCVCVIFFCFCCCRRGQLKKSISPKTIRPHYVHYLSVRFLEAILHYLETVRLAPLAFGNKRSYFSLSFSHSLSFSPSKIRWELRFSLIKNVIKRKQAERSSVLFSQCKQWRWRMVGALSLSCVCACDTGEKVWLAARPAVHSLLADLLSSGSVYTVSI